MVALNLHFNDNSGKYAIECSGFDFSEFEVEWGLKSIGRVMRPLLELVPQDVPKCFLLGSCAPKQHTPNEVAMQLQEVFAQPFRLPVVFFSKGTVWDTLIDHLESQFLKFFVRDGNAVIDCVPQACIGYDYPFEVTLINSDGIVMKVAAANKILSAVRVFQ
jgi:hypothetical protein